MFIQTKIMKKVIVLILLVFGLGFLGCTTQSLDEVLVFAPEVKDEYDFSELKVPESNWSLVWITNGNISTCVLKIDRKQGVNDDLSNIVIAYFHGNRSSLEDSPVAFGNMFYELGINFIAVEYRGFGIVKGFTPSEESVYEDGESLINYIESLGVSRSNIIIIGHSLGGGIATEMAKRHQFKGLILISTFTKIEDAGEMVSTYRVPSRWYVKSMFDNISKIDLINDPLLVIHGKSDTTLSFDYGVALYNKARNPKDYLWIENCNHTGKEIVEKGGQQLRDKIIEFIRNN